MVKNLLSLLLLFAFLATGCNSSKPADPEEEEAKPALSYYLQRRLTTIHFPEGPTTTDLHYAYNAKNQLTGITGVSGRNNVPINMAFTYDQKDRLTHIYASQYFSWELTYDNKNRLVKQLRIATRSDGTIGFHYYLNSYNIGDELIESRAYNIINGRDDLSYTYTFTYSGSQVSNIIALTENGSLITHYSFNHDLNKKPFSKLPLLTVPRYGHDLPDLPGIGLSTHNLTSVTTLFNTGVKDPQKSYAASHTYNDAGYPVKTTKTYGNGVVEVIDYTYITK